MECPSSDKDSCPGACRLQDKAEHLTTEEMCGGTAKTTTRPGAWQDSARCVSDAVSGAGRICKTLLHTRTGRRAGVGRGADPKELRNRFGILVVSESDCCPGYCLASRWNRGDLKSFSESRERGSEAVFTGEGRPGVLSDCGESCPPAFFLFPPLELPCEAWLRPCPWLERGR